MKLNKGFTIIEMVIVIAIIGILASVLIPTYGNVVASANESAALQTARSTMTNWLSSATSSAGVPTSGTDANGNEFYAAYFEYSNSDNGQIYQFRYTSGGVERTDDNPSKYVNFSQTDKKVANISNSGLPQYVDEAYLTTPQQDTGMSGNESKYKVSLYKQTVGTGAAISTNYYVKYGATSAYTCGGADVYAAVGAKTVVYIKNGANYVACYLDGSTDESVTGTLTWKATTNTGATAAPAATTYTITFNGLTGEDATATTGTDGKLASLPSAGEGNKWYDAETGGNEVTTATVFTKDTTLYAHA